MILQPTSPLRQPQHIREAIDLLLRTDADSVVSTSAVPSHYHPLRTLRIEPSGDAVLFVTGQSVRHRINRRQDLPPASVMNGAIYVFRRDVLFAAEPSLYGDRTVGYSMPDPFGLSIDEPEDWVEAERALAATVTR
jgi:CMP-N-acetylneuraminic acid synthetase